MSEIATTLALREEGLERVCARLSLQQRRHPELPALVLLKYSMTESPMGDPVVRQCRGLIVDESDGFRPVAYPYDKFFNQREGHAASIDWSTARVLEKADGMLCTLYPYAGRWHVATMSNPDASGALRGRGGTVAEAFWQLFHGAGGQLPERADHCFMFELCLPSDPILVRHERPRLVVHGARDGSVGLRWEGVKGAPGEGEQTDTPFVTPCTRLVHTSLHGGLRPALARPLAPGAGRYRRARPMRRGAGRGAAGPEGGTRQGRGSGFAGGGRRAGGRGRGQGRPPGRVPGGEVCRRAACSRHPLWFSYSYRALAVLPGRRPLAPPLRSVVTPPSHPR